MADETLKNAGSIEAQSAVPDGVVRLSRLRRGRPAWRVPRRIWHLAKIIVGPSIVPLALVALWAALTYSKVVPSVLLPSPTELWQSAYSLRNVLPDAIESSVIMTLAGFAIGCSLGILIGLSMAYSKVTRELFGGVMNFIRPVPVFALIPLFVLWFGISKTPQIALISLGCSVILGVTTVEAVRNVPPVYVRGALTLGASRLTIYRTVVIPWTFPHLLGAIRVAAAASWGLDVAAEYLGAQSGLGYLMILREQYLDTAGIVLIVLIYSLMALALDSIIRIAESPLTRWSERSVRGGIAAAILGGS
jgi:ABC-type nitrate/sulfonate/bicarbonate transport system permease component